LRAAGWRVTTEHAASCGQPVLVAPDGTAVGDAQLVCVLPDGTVSEDLFADGGCLTHGAVLRHAVTDAAD